MTSLIRPIVFSIPAYESMAAQIAAKLGADIGEIERKQFPDGEVYQRLISSVADRDVILVGGMYDDAQTLPFYDLACAIAKYGARRLDMVIPYFGYSTMERSIIAGEVITAKTRTRLLSAIPEAARGNRAWFVDLHAEGIPHYCEGHLVARHIYGKPVLVPHFRELGGDVLASTDAGRAKWVQSLAQELCWEAAIIIKRRLSGSETEVSAVSCDVKGKDVVIYDDMIRTGGSLRGAVKSYVDAGAKSIKVVATHGVFPGDAYEKLAAMPEIISISCSDSHPRAVELAEKGLVIIPLAEVICDKIIEGGP
ncbi:MAG: ribose-phosphate pyrophosphokinase [Planctomycetes bacterium]|nr:ribose-phosphate pyrophosphokinase [Planctomycetota bacterium]